LIQQNGAPVTQDEPLAITTPDAQLKRQAAAAFAYAIDPIRRQPVEDPQVMRTLDHACEALGLQPLGPTPPQVVGWRLTLSVEGQPTEQRDFDGADDGFRNAQDAGCAWLAQHGADSIDQWIAGSFQASRRMGWDRAYQHAISMREF
jgi:hypothetical protein